MLQSREDSLLGGVNFSGGGGGGQDPGGHNEPLG